MARGSRPGEHRGGRQKGSKNLATIERETREAQQRARVQLRQPKVRLAKDVIEEFMMIGIGYAAKYQKAPEGQTLPQGREPDEEKFKEWAQITVGWATDLARYQSPTYRAIQVSPLERDEEDEGIEYIHTIEQVRQQLLIRGIPPDQFAKAISRKTIEHDPMKKESSLK
jgi:hypothetical protein